MRDDSTAQQLPTQSIESAIPESSFSDLTRALVGIMLLAGCYLLLVYAKELGQRVAKTRTESTGSLWTALGFNADDKTINSPAQKKRGEDEERLIGGIPPSARQRQKEAGATAPPPKSSFFNKLTAFQQEYRSNSKAIPDSAGNALERGKQMANDTTDYLIQLPEEAAKKLELDKLQQESKQFLNSKRLGR